MKKITAALIFLVSAAFFAGAEQLTRVGVIDLSAIVSSYFKESQAWREVDDMSQQFEAEKQSILNEIDQLEYRKIDARNRGNDNEALRLDNEIFSRKNYLQEFTRIKSSQISKKKDSLLESPTFLAELLTEIQYIAETKGFSLILRSKDPDLLWWNQEVDVTNDVLKRLREKSGKR